MQPGFGAPPPNGGPVPGFAPPGYPAQPGYGVPQQGSPGAQAYGAPGYPGVAANPYGGQANPYQAGNYGAGQAQQFQPEPGPPGIVLDTSYTPMAFMLALTGPTILVNGQPVPAARWGATHIPLGAGQHHVRVSTRWMWDMGPAEAMVPVAEGQSTRVYYRAPAIAFIRGAIGPVPQSTPGILFTYLIFGFAVLMILLNIALIAIAP